MKYKSFDYEYILKFIVVYLSNHFATSKKDTRSIFLAGFNSFKFRVFFSPRMVAFPRLQNPVCPTIYPTTLSAKAVEYTDSSAEE